MNDLYYTVTAYRWGSRDDHSYVVGLYSTPALALDAADREEAWRGAKYECEVLGWVPDQGLAGDDRKQATGRVVLRALPAISTIKGHSLPCR